MARRRIDRAYLPSSYASAVVINSNTQATYVEMVFHNTDTSNREVSVREVPQGATPSAVHLVLNWTGLNILRPNETRIAKFQPSLDAGDFYEWKSDVANKVTAAAFINEEGV